MLRLIWVTIGFAALAALVSACRQDGENPYVLWTPYSHPKGDFSFYYLTPLFVRGADFKDEHPILVVDRFSDPVEGELDARIHVEAWSDKEHSAQTAFDDRKKYWEAKGYRLEQQLTYLNYFGEEGIMFVMERGDQWLKELFFSYKDGCVAISAWTNERGSREDIEFLLKGFRPGE
ncbi:MAG: hypothetical protein JXR76_07150 [Deltaproteobacteria bacterium]|nr:hypothetical protein [Deltaproteobacteria bacterium]